MNIIHYNMKNNENYRLKMAQRFLLLSKDIQVIHRDAIVSST